MYKHPLPSVPQGHDDSPLYTQTVASDSPTHENDRVPVFSLNNFYQYYYWYSKLFV